jgi:4-amino-4-deoxy-L-arabinose transferase-like glycosyltransferase
VLWLALLPARPLFNTDEGRYAEIPREMLVDGDWVIPHLNGLAYIEKPPLQYWATALSLRMFGNNEFGARLYTALCALGTLVVVWVLAGRLWGGEVAWRSSAVLASMLLFVVMGQLLTLDMSLTFYLTLALAAFLLAQPRACTPGMSCMSDSAGRRWMVLAWVAAGLGVLSKGLVAAVIPAAVLVLYSLLARDFSPWRHLHAAVGVPLFLAVTVPWHWLAARRLPGFLEFFFVHEHLARYLTPSADREEVWWFFAAVFALGTLPWTGSALRVTLFGWRRRAAGGQFDAALFLWIWVLFIGVFFSFSDSKLIPYLLPAVPAVAVLVGASAAERLRRDAIVAACVTLLAGIGLVAAGVLGPHWLPTTERNRYFLQLAAPLRDIGLLLAVAGVFVLSRCRRNLTAAAVSLGVGWCVAALWLTRAAAAVAPIYSGVVLARAFELEQVPRDVPLYSVATYDQTLPFYARRLVTLVAYRGELDFGLRQDPAAGMPAVDGFVSRWQGLTDGYAVMEISMFDELKRRDVPMRDIARDLHRVLVARR